MLRDFYSATPVVSLVITNIRDFCVRKLAHQPWMTAGDRVPCAFDDEILHASVGMPRTMYAISSAVSRVLMVV